MFRHTKVHAISSQCERSVRRVTANNEALPPVGFLKFGNYGCQLVVTCVKEKFITTQWSVVKGT